MAWSGHGRLTSTADTRHDWVSASELGRFYVGRGRLDDYDGSTGRHTTVPPGCDAHDHAVVLDHLVSDQQLQDRLAGGIIEVTLALIGGATKRYAHLDLALDLPGTLCIEFPTRFLAPGVIGTAAEYAALAG